MFFNECWIDRYNAMHDEEDKKKILTQWYEKVLNQTMDGDSEVISHAERTKLDIDRSQNENFRSWMLVALKIKWNLKTPSG